MLAWRVDRPGPIADRPLRRADLPADELRAIGQILGVQSSALYLGERATETNVRQMQLSNSRVLMFATHGLLASETAQFCTPGVNIGLFCSTPMVALTRNVSRKRAMEMLLLGEMLPAREAAEYGLVNRVVAPDKVLDEALALAALIASKPPVTVATGKEAFYKQIEMPLAEAYDYAACVMVENMLHAESKEGIGAFLEKRPADWDKS